MVVESHDDFPGVEISIAGGVGEMVCDFNDVLICLTIDCIYPALKT